MLFCYSALWSSSTFFIPSSTCVLYLLVLCCCQPTSSLSIYSQRLRPPSRKFFAAIAKFAIQTLNYSSVLSSISSFLLLLAQMSWLVLMILSMKILYLWKQEFVSFCKEPQFVNLFRSQIVPTDSTPLLFAILISVLCICSGNCPGGDASFSRERIINSGQT